MINISGIIISWIVIDWLGLTDSRSCTEIEFSIHDDSYLFEAF